MTKFLSLISSMMIISSALLLGGCNKTYDQPPGPADLPIVANSTIASLKAQHTLFGQLDLISSDIIISGIVTANDKSGNFYKEMYVEDSTGAIRILIDASGLYTTYPVGRRVYIYCKGLYITDENGLMELGVRAVVAGAPSLEGILNTDVSNYIKAGSINNPVVPTTVTVSQLGTSMQSPNIGRLVKLEGFEFTTKDSSKTYGDTSAYKSTRNDTIQDCNNIKTIIRSSAYADFAAVNVPNGNGTVTAIYTVYRTTKQFIIRDTSDVQMNNPRCGALPPGTKVLLQEDFETQVVPAAAPYNTVSVAGWMNVAEAGGKTWDARTFGGTKYAQLSGFGSTQNTITSWLVTRGILMDTTNSESLSFKTQQGYSSTAADLKILVSTNYSGTGNPWASGVNWTDVTSQATLSPGSATGFPGSFTASGSINLSSYSGTLYVAFRYEGADPAGTTSDKTSTWQLDDILVIGL